MKTYKKDDKDLDSKQKYLLEDVMCICRNLFITVVILTTIIVSSVSEGQTIVPGALHGGEILLGRPTNSSISFNIVSDTTSITPGERWELYIAYGKTPDTLDSQTEVSYSESGEPVDVSVTGLDPNTEYYYAMRYREYESVEDSWFTSEVYTFQTQRLKGESFVFTVQSDSHLGSDQIPCTEIHYKNMVSNVIADNPDLHFDLGDTFVVESWPNGCWDTSIAGDIREELGCGAERIHQIYLEQREYLGQIGRLAPVFLVIGNQEHESGWNLDDFDLLQATLPLMNQNARKRYFLNPVSNEFYSSVPEPLAEIVGDHLRDAFYAFHWGDALFIVLDPFWYTVEKPYSVHILDVDEEEKTGDEWSWTLGRVQYDWFRQTLETSPAKFKFVFIHHLTGGTNTYDPGYGRGGVAAAQRYEWGGRNMDGHWEFHEKRSLEDGWDQPIHQIMVENGVTILFHGHDHLFAKEELDAIIYQECPRSCDSSGNITLTSLIEDYASALENEDAQPNAGHVRVTVEEDDVTVDYVRSGTDNNGEVTYSYQISAVPDNSPPIVQNRTLATIEDRPLGIRLTANDPDGGTISYEILIEPQNGILTGIGVEWTYLPDNNFHGDDYFAYRAFDGENWGNIGYYNIVVTSEDDEPINEIGTIVGLEDTPIKVELPLADGDGQTLDLVLVEPPTYGELVGNLAGNLVYYPDSDYYGLDSFLYRAFDGTHTVEIEVVIEIEPVNDAPILYDQNVTITEDTPKEFRPFAVDRDGDVITFHIVEGASHGIVTSNNGSTLTYEPSQDYFGEDSFTFTCSDGIENSETVIMHIEVLSVDDPLEANDLDIRLQEDNPTSITLSVKEGNIEDLIFTVITPPANGEIVGGTGPNQTYVPNDDINGTDKFWYVVSNDVATSLPAIVSINIEPVPDAPVAADMNISTTISSPVEIDISSTDVDGDILSYSILNQPSHGVASLDGDIIRYAPHHGYVGEDSFAYIATDSTFLSDSGLVKISVGEAVDPSTPSGDNLDIDEEKTVELVDAGAMKKEDVVTEYFYDSGITIDASANGTYSAVSADSCGCGIIAGPKSNYIIYKFIQSVF